MTRVTSVASVALVRPSTATKGNTLKSRTKHISAPLVLVPALLAIGFLAAPSADASESKNVTYCQATASETNPYVVVTAAENSVIDKDGVLKQGGVNEGDIIPPFDYNFGGSSSGTFAGQNWTKENQTLWQNGCKPTGNVLTPILPEAPVQTCANPNPTFTVPTQPEGVNVTSAADDRGNYTVFYALPQNTKHSSYVFPEGFVNPVTVTTVDNRPNDPMWDESKQACNLPDTGAGEVNSLHVLYAGVLIFAGLVLKTFVGRRRIA